MKRIGAIQLSAMLAALLLSAGLVLRISATLTPVAPETRTDTGAVRAVVLRDSMGGEQLFKEVELAPGEWREECITVSATGTRVPEVVTLELTRSLVDPTISEWLELDVVRGDGPLAAGSSCEGFEEVETVASGPADLVLAAFDRGVDWDPATGFEVPGGHATTYRLSAHLLPTTPNRIQGAAIGFDLQWSTQFEAAGEGLWDRILALAIRFSEDSMIPMLAILAVAILFLGIQDRLDTATPRLSKAVLFDEVIEFEETEPSAPAPSRVEARDP